MKKEAVLKGNVKLIQHTILSADVEHIFRVAGLI